MKKNIFLSLIMLTSQTLATDQEGRCSQDDDLIRTHDFTNRPKFLSKDFLKFPVSDNETEDVDLLPLDLCLSNEEETSDDELPHINLCFTDTAILSVSDNETEEGDLPPLYLRFPEEEETSDDESFISFDTEGDLEYKDLIPFVLSTTEQDEKRNDRATNESEVKNESSQY